MADFLVEIGTEELPPKALNTLSDAFTQAVIAGLDNAELAHGEYSAFATPRRLALVVRSLSETQPDKTVDRRGPAVQAAFDQNGNPTKAAEGFAASCGVTIDQLDRLKTDKGEWLSYRAEQKGLSAAVLIPAIVEKALADLPIPKRMRWGSNEAEFVRPVHWVVLMLDQQVIPATILGLESGNATRGHRFHHPELLTVNAGNYALQLENPGQVIADFSRRREMVRTQVIELAQQLGGEAVIDVDLLDEVTALVEWPVALAGGFDKAFLEAPHEALINTMEDNQKYFAVVDKSGHLMPHFITVSNINSQDPKKVIEGNERVIRPRFADAVFFWEQDKKQKLENRIDSLKSIVFQQQLGSLWDKTQRVTALAKTIASEINADVAQAERAAQLSKCDLVTNMVGEFPKMQGIAGRYYALHDGEVEAVASALEAQYLPKYAGDDLPETGVSQAVAIADKVDTLVGIFGIGQKPSGTRDPFALRRAALGVLRIIIEKQLDLDLDRIIDQAIVIYGKKLTANSVKDDTLDYILDRLNAYYQDKHVKPGVIDAVMARRPTRPLDFDRRTNAVKAFNEMSEAESLAAANKRIGNILKKTSLEQAVKVDENLLQEAAEKMLFNALHAMEREVTPLLDAGDYEPALKQLAGLREPVDQFFDDVMVMTDDEALKNNRLALLKQMRNLFLRTADLSRLQ